MCVSQTLGGLADILSMMKNSCLTLSSSAVGDEKTDGDALLEVRIRLYRLRNILSFAKHAGIPSDLSMQRLFTATQVILSPRPLVSSEHVSGLLTTVEKSVLLIGPQLKHNRTKMETNETGNSREERRITGT